MSKTKELLERMEKEIFEKVNEIVLRDDELIKNKANEAYNLSIEESISEIKKEIENEYKIAREYLTQLINEEEEEGQQQEEENCLNETIENEELKEETKEIEECEKASENIGEITGEAEASEPTVIQ